MENIKEIITEDEKTSFEYLKKIGLAIEKYDKGKYDGKRTDFRVFESNKLAFYAEVKTFIYNTSEDLLHNTMFNKFSGKIRDANKQFQSVNKNHKVPNVLFLFSNDYRINWSKFHSFLIAKYDYGTGTLLLNKYRDGRSMEAVRNIDLYIWLYKDYRKYFLTSTVRSLKLKLLSIFHQDMINQ